MNHALRILFTEQEIQLRVAAVAREIAALSARPEILVPVLSGAFVFAADLCRALTDEGLDLPIEFLWLRSYGAKRQADEILVRAEPGEAVRGKHVLLIDGILDRGHTLTAARELLRKVGVTAVTTAVVVDKLRTDASIAADFACFAKVDGFIAGYGMDDAGRARGLSHIARVE